MGMTEKIYKLKKVPRDIRKAALLAIKFGSNPEAIDRFNRVADEINQVSFYEQKFEQLPPFELI